MDVSTDNVASRYDRIYSFVRGGGDMKMKYRDRIHLMYSI